MELDAPKLKKKQALLTVCVSAFPRVAPLGGFSCVWVGERYSPCAHDDNECKKEHLSPHHLYYRKKRGKPCGPRPHSPLKSHFALLFWHATHAVRLGCRDPSGARSTANGPVERVPRKRGSGRSGGSVKGSD